MIIDGVVNIALTAQEQIYLVSVRSLFRLIILSISCYSQAWGESIKDSPEVFEGFTTACALAGPSNCNLTKDGWAGSDVAAFIESAIDVSITCLYAGLTSLLLMLTTIFFDRPRILPR